MVMKMLTELSKLCEAKLHGTRLSYVETIDDRFGDADTKKYVTTGAELQQLKALWNAATVRGARSKKQKEAVKNADIAFGAALDNSGLAGMHAEFELFGQSWNKMQASVQRTGSWSQEFEEGGMAVSAKGPKHAAQLAKAEFMKAFDSGDDDDEDWY